MKKKETHAINEDEIQLYRIPEVASRLGISVSAVRREIDGGRLQAYRIGRSVTVSLSAIKAFLQRLEIR